GRDLLTARDVLVIDEAGMVGTRQLERVLSQATEAGAKVVLVGDPQQLQSIEAGAAFRWVHERHGGAELGEVRRQREDWQREATRDLATGSISEAIDAYDSHGMVHQARTRDEARGDLIEGWDRDRQISPDQSRIILTHTNDEVRALNEAARERMRAAGDLGDDVGLTVERGARHFASGDRVMFLQNDRGLGVKNGTLGTIEKVDTQNMTVRTDDGRGVSFDFKDYDRIDHGYAATIHKAQGMTVDRTHVLATPGMDAHASYVALSRHRDGVELHYGRDDFTDQDKLIRTLSRDRAKDMASDYQQLDPAQAYAERRRITLRERVAEIVRKIVPEQLRLALDDLRDGLRQPGDAAPGPEVRPGPERGEGRQGTERPAREQIDVPRETAAPERAAAEDREAALRKARTKALIRHARASDAILEAKRQGLAPSDEERRELGAARRAFDEVRPYGWQDAEAAYNKDNGLAREAGTGRVNPTIRALQLETELRLNPAKDPNWRADRFVERFRDLRQAGERQYAAGNYSSYR
ncbi:MAG: AAA family ATPase, partial [Aestuariivirga sp.]